MSNLWDVCESSVFSSVNRLISIKSKILNLQKGKWRKSHRRKLWSCKIKCMIILVCSNCKACPTRILKCLTFLLDLIIANPYLKYHIKIVSFTAKRILRIQLPLNQGYLEVPTIRWANRHTTGRMKSNSRNTSIPTWQVTQYSSLPHIINTKGVHSNKQIQVQKIEA